MTDFLSENASALLAYIHEHPGLTQTDIVEHFGMHPSQVLSAILELEENGLIETHHDNLDYFTEILTTYYPVKRLE